ncbi:acetylcholinesterase-like [Amphiura filiformis]|uniref:acetylcholinesterase-like n=1 Tax=Amphiura filiformis TaxID=82378 RepID=UPI003B22551C
MLTSHRSFLLNIPISDPPPINRQQYNALLASYLAGYGYQSEIIVEGVNQVYVDWASADDPTTDYLSTYLKVQSDKSFICDMDRVARAHASVGDVVYTYHFTHVSSVKKLPDWTGATHTEELQYVFGYAFNPLLTEYHSATNEEKRLAVNVMKYWTSFAKYGDPNFEESGELYWPDYTIPELQYKEIAVNLTSGRALKAEECHFWNEHLQQLGTFVGDLGAVELEWREEFNRWKYDDMVLWRHEFDKYLEDTKL